MKRWWNNIGRENLSTGEKVVWSAACFTTTLHGPGSGPGHHGENPVNNCLGHKPVANRQSWPWKEYWKAIP